MAYGSDFLFFRLLSSLKLSRSLRRSLTISSSQKKDFRVTVEDGVYFVEADWLLDILRTANMDDYSSLQYFQNVLRTSGIIDKLEEMGIEEGDTVSIFDFEFEYLR